MTDLSLPAPAADLRWTLTKVPLAGGGIASGKTKSEGLGSPSVGLAALAARAASGALPARIARTAEIEGGGRGDDRSQVSLLLIAFVAYKAIDNRFGLADQIPSGGTRDPLTPLLLNLIDQRLQPVGRRGFSSV